MVLEAANFLLGLRVGDDGQLIAIQLTPTANIGVAKLDEVDRTFELGPPLGRLDSVLPRVNLDKGPRTDQRVKSEVFQADKTVQGLAKVQVRDHGYRDLAPVFDHP